MSNYDAYEALRHYAELQEIKRAPIAERREHCEDFAKAMRDPEIVGKRLSWLLSGDYGYGAQQAAEKVLKQGKGANKIASLNLLVGALEWRCPADMAIKAWKSLTGSQKEALDNVLRRVIREKEREEILAAMPDLMASPHGLCKRSRTCVEHKQDKSVPSCKSSRSKGRKVP